MSWYNPKSWGRPFEDLYNKGKDAIIDTAQEIAANVVDVSEVIGAGVTDFGGMIGDGVVTMGESAAKWSVTAAGDVVDWSKTSFSEVRDWTEGAAGDFAGFTVNLYESASSELEAAGKFLYEQLTNFFTETLPKLGPIDPQVRAVAAALLTEDVARGLERAAKASFCTITVGLRAQALGSATAGIYVCGDGWGLCHGATLSLIQGAIKLLQDGATITGSTAMIFGPRERASGVKAFKLGVSLAGKAPGKPGLGIGGVLLMEASAPPLFLGFRYEVVLSFGLGGKKTPDNDGKVKWQIKATKPPTGTPPCAPSTIRRAPIGSSRPAASTSSSSAQTMRSGPAPSAAAPGGRGARSAAKSPLILRRSPALRDRSMCSRGAPISRSSAAASKTASGSPGAPPPGGSTSPRSARTGRCGSARSADAAHCGFSFEHPARSAVPLLVGIGSG